MLAAPVQLLTMSSFAVTDVPAGMINYMLTRSLGPSKGPKVTSGTRPSHSNPLSGLVASVVGSFSGRGAGCPACPGATLVHSVRTRSSCPLGALAGHALLLLSSPGRPLMTLSSPKHASSQLLALRMGHLQFQGPQLPTTLQRWPEQTPHAVPRWQHQTLAQQSPAAL